MSARAFLWWKKHKSERERNKGVVIRMRILSGNEVRQYVPRSFRMEMDGNCELYLEGCKSIISYKPEAIRVQLNKMIFSIFGSELTIENMNGNTMVVRGQIVKMEFMN